MCMILEIILTIVAWRKGWRWLALLPMGVGGGIGALIGLGIGLSGASQSQLQSAMPVFLIFDIIAVVVLIVMICKPRTLPTPPKDGSSLGLGQ
jgi:uncharacterized membrane protein YfcA